MLVLTVLELTGCKSAKVLRGDWNACDYEEETFTITFEEKAMIIDKGKAEGTYELTQNAMGLQGDASYYAMIIQGKTYAIIFPTRNGNEALFIEPTSTENYFNGNLIYVMNRKEIPSFAEYAPLWEGKK